MKKVLIVEDYPVMAGVIKFDLEKAGYGVGVAENGREALALLEEKDFDLIVVDYQMPELNGEELCLQLKESDRLAQIPVVMMTGKTGCEPDVRRLKDDLGLLGVFCKPRLKELRQLIQDYFAGATSPN